MNEKHLKSRLEVQRVFVYGKVIMVLDGLPIAHQYIDCCNGVVQEVDDAKDVNKFVQDFPVHKLNKI